MEKETRFECSESLPVTWRESTWQPRVIIRSRARLVAQLLTANRFNLAGFAMVRMGIMGGANRNGTRSFSAGTQPRINL